MTNVDSQKYECQHADNDGWIIVLFPLKNFVQWQHHLAVAFKVFLQLTKLLIAHIIVIIVT